jgi:hypothetical protein
MVRLGVSLGEDNITYNHINIDTMEKSSIVSLSKEVRKYMCPHSGL